MSRGILSSFYVSTAHLVSTESKSILTRPGIELTLIMSPNSWTKSHRTIPNLKVLIFLLPSCYWCWCCCCYCYCHAWPHLLLLYFCGFSYWILAVISHSFFINSSHIIYISMKTEETCIAYHICWFFQMPDSSVKYFYFIPQKLVTITFPPYMISHCFTSTHSFSVFIHPY